MHVSLVHYLTVAAVLFGLGLFTVMTRRNGVVVWISEGSLRTRTGRRPSA